MTNWQPIETAPHGEKVLVYSAPSRHKGEVSFGILKQNSCDDAPKWSLNGSRIKGHYHPPTAWMHIPPAPVEV